MFVFCVLCCDRNEKQKSINNQGYKFSTLNVFTLDFTCFVTSPPVKSVWTQTFITAFLQQSSKTCDNSVLTAQGRVSVDPVEDMLAVIMLEITSRHLWGKSIPAEIINIQPGWKPDTIMPFKMCFSAWSSGCGGNRRVPHVVSMCPCWSPSTGHRPAPQSHNGPAPALAMTACPCDPLTPRPPPHLSPSAWTPETTCCMRVSSK